MLQRRPTKGIIEDEYAEIYAKDRIDHDIRGVAGNDRPVCATCHDHKFDPISQKDFYALGAFFRNTTQKVLDGNVATPPIVVVPRAADRQPWDRVTSRLEAIRAEMEETARRRVPFQQWLERRDRISSRRVRLARKTSSTHWTCALATPTRRWRRAILDPGPARSPFPQAKVFHREGSATRGGKAFSISASFHFPTAERST